MQRVQSFINLTIMGTVLGHVLCCGLPTVVSIISLVSGLGIMVTLPLGLDGLHDFIHDYEIAILVFSGTMLAFGWVLHEISRRIDCRDTGCGHPPCAPKKKSSVKLLIFASFLFAINLAVYVFTHDMCDHCLASEIAALNGAHKH